LSRKNVFSPLLRDNKTKSLYTSACSGTAKIMLFRWEVADKMEYTIDTATLPAHVSMTPVPVYDSLEAKVAKAPVARPSLWRRVAIYGALLLGLGVSACGPGDNPSDPINPIPSGYSVSDNMTPADGSVVSGSDLEVGLDTPAVPAECAADDACAAAAAGGLDVSYEIVSDNATPGNTSDDVVLGTDSQTGVPFGSYTSTTVDLTGVPDGAGIEARVTATATDSEGTEHSVEGSAGWAYDAGSVNPVRVTGCNVMSSVVGASLGINCTCESSAGPVTGYFLTGGPAGAIITGSGTIGAPTMEAGDVNNYTYDVTCTDGTNTSDHYIFTAPVDIYRGTNEGACTDGTNFSLLQPELIVRDGAAACSGELLQDPSGPGDDKIVDLNSACIGEFYTNLSPEESELVSHYNMGVTPLTVCDGHGGIDFIQAKLHQN
jgi:hypothetical protein